MFAQTLQVMDKLFPELNGLALQDALANASDVIYEKQKVKIALAPAEIGVLKSDMAEDAMTREELTDEMSDIVKDYKAKIKALKDRVNVSRKLLRSKQREVITTVHGVISSDDRTMQFYSPSGEFLYARPVNADERKQRSLGYDRQTGTQV